MREERILLAEVAERALLRREGRAPSSVEPGPAVEDDPARVRALEPGQAAQHGRLPGSGGTEEYQHVAAPGPDLELRADPGSALVELCKIGDQQPGIGPAHRGASGPTVQARRLRA